MNSEEHYEDETFEFDDHDDQSVQMPLATSGADVVAPNHSLLLEALKSSKFLSPSHIEVINESYWYAMRSRLCPRRQLALIAKQNPNSMRWESFIFKMKPREEDLEVVPQRQFISTHKSKFAAIRTAEKACKERDSNPADNIKVALFIDPAKITATHFRLIVASERFDRLSNMERVALVYESLLSALGRNVDPYLQNVDGGRAKRKLGICPPSKFKLGSFYGPNMCRLPVFRFLLFDVPTTLIIETKTLSQWRADVFAASLSERLSSTHVGMNSLDIAKTTKPSSNKFRIKQLARVVSERDSFLPSIHEKTSMSKGYTALADSIGLDPIVSGASMRKSGGVHGHFFADLSPEVKTLIMKRFKENKVMIQKEGHVSVAKDKKKKGKKVDSHVPKTSLSLLRAATGATAGAYDIGTTSESEMMEEVLIASKVIERLAVRLQRIRRITVTHRAAKWIWRRQYSAIMIQKCTRGLFGRMYANMMRHLEPIAATRIQRCFRDYRSRVIVAVWHYLTFRLTRWVLPKIKRFIRNCFISWMRRHFKFAAVIQSVVRMHLCRIRYWKMLGNHYLLEQYIPFAVVQIQRVVRGRIGRKIHASLFEKVLHVRIDQPAALRLQRVYRGHLGRKRAKRKRKEVRSANLLQRNVRHFLKKLHQARCAQAALEKRSATLIQKRYRGRLDRERYAKIHATWIYWTKFIPAVVLVQSVARGHYARLEFHELKARNKAAFFIQQYYAKYKRRVAAMARWLAMRMVLKNAMAVVIQKYLRRFFAKKGYRRKWLINHGRCILAGKKILRAWVNFKQV